MVPPDGSIITFTKGFYKDRKYLVVNGGELVGTFWEFCTDGNHIGPLGEARWNPECEKVAVEWRITCAPSASLQSEQPQERLQSGPL